MENSIETYDKVTRIRAILKAVQQLSWDISAIDKRFPLDIVSEDQLPDLLVLYEGLRERLLDLVIGANGGEPL